MPASSREPIVMHAPESELTPSELGDLRARLQAEREVLLARAGDLLDESEQSRATATAHSHGESERAVADAERRVNAVLEAGARDALDEVVGALARIDDGTYGRCEDCRVAIPAERLQARPAARFCVRCQQRRDARR
jgi:RNA polymerase-binding transcription factor DksA